QCGFLQELSANHLHGLREDRGSSLRRKPSSAGVFLQVGWAASFWRGGSETTWNLVQEFDTPACCIIKHTNPCGTAIAGSLREAYVKAYEADTVSAFG